MALVPAVQVWHLSFGAHSHRYCPTHERIEEVAAAQRLPTNGSYDAPALRQTSTAGTHFACTLLNWDLSRKQQSLPRPALSSSPAVLGADAVAPPAPPLRVAWALILSAPKNSPPHSLA